MFRFANPQLLWLSLLIVALVYYTLSSRRRERSVAFSSLHLLEAAGLDAGFLKRHGQLIMRVFVLLLLVTALARPQTGRSQSTVKTEGIDIVLLLDTSSSMQAQDFKPKNRLHAAKQVMADFIAKRTNDRMGLVVFAAQSITQCPLTLDHDILQELVDGVDFGMLEDGTAIGSALATACNRLKDSEAKSRIVVLLTDGRNNMGVVAPATAAEVAKSLGIKVYTIGVGTRGLAPMPINDPVFGRRTVSMEMQLDEKTLQHIADVTEGAYFRATDREELEEIYDRIDELERTTIETSTFVNYTDRFMFLVVPALALLVLQLVASELWLREIP